MWLAALDPAAWGALGTGAAALIGAVYAIWKGTRQTPSRAFELIDQLQEDNGRIRAELRAAEAALWEANRTRRQEHEECQKRIALLEKRHARRR